MDYEISGNISDLMHKFDNGCYKYTYLEGDFSSIEEFASIYKGTDYGGYHVLNNNCLHYVHHAINFAYYGYTNLLYDPLETIVPRVYRPRLKPDIKNQNVILPYIIDRWLVKGNATTLPSLQKSISFIKFPIIQI